MQKIPAPRPDPMIPPEAPRPRMSDPCVHGDVMAGFYEVDFWDPKFGADPGHRMVAIYAVTGYENLN